MALRFVEAGCIEELATFLAQNPQTLTETFSEQRSLLHVAVKTGNVAIAKLLIEKGANVNSLDVNRDTPLAFVSDATPNSAEMRQLLLDNGAVADLEYFHYDQPEAKPSDEDNTNFIDRQFLTRVFVTFLLPFIVLMLYNGPIFCLCFASASTVFYFVAVGFFVSQITVKPPWYHPAPGAKSLSMKHLPENWKNMVHNPLKNFGIGFEDVEFASQGGCRLRGWLVPGAKPRIASTCIVFVHGGGRDRRTWLRHLPMFHKQGYTCLLFDLREHGTSDGAHRGLSYGMSERFDALAAARFMKDRGWEKVVLIGTSMGGSTAIMAAALDSKAVDGVIAENPLLTCAHLQKQHIAELLGGYFKHSFWGRFVYAVFQRMCSIWLNIRVGNKPSKHCQSVHVVSKISPRPLLLMHGTYDTIVPFEHSKKLFDVAKEPKQLWLAPGAFHTGLYDAFPKEFESTVADFLRRHELR